MALCAIVLILTNFIGSTVKNFVTQQYRKIHTSLTKLPKEHLLFPLKDNVFLNNELRQREYHSNLHSSWGYCINI